MFQPQVASWDKQKTIVMYAAVSYGPRGATKPSLGTAKLEANSEVAIEERLVNFSGLRLAETNFPGMPQEQLREIVTQIQQETGDGNLVIALDRVLAQVDKSAIIPRNMDGVKAEPPVIFYSATPAVVVNIDGDPVWSPIKENDLRFLVNTNWDLFEYPPEKTFYLRYEKGWLSASEHDGPWKADPKLPDAFKKLPANDANWDDVRKSVPGSSLGKKAPRVFVSKVPAELILLTGGAPNYVSVQGTKELLWVSNTESDLFRMGKAGQVYFLISGRWFSAPDFTGPWTFATPNMPEEFKNIPLSHDRSRVLASIPGTDQAAEAVLLAQVPQTARVSKKTVKAPDVAYQGDPKFEPIDKTTVSRAVNTDKDIIKVGDIYYMCFQGVWFMGRSPQGPWEVTGSIPGEVYEIPITSPSYPVTQVTVVQEDDDDEWVVFVAAAAYTGMMVAWGCAVWGTGYYYPPYVGYGGYYPYYRPYYPSYGYHASYNPWTGAYSRGVSAYGPYGGAGVGASYNPRTGTYARGAAAYGPYGARGAATAYNPRTNTWAGTRQGAGVYGSWGQTGVQRGDDWAKTSRVTNNRTGATTRATTTSNGAAAVTRNGVVNNSGAVRTADGDVYAGRDGNVYKRNDGGGWSQYDNGSGGWNNVQANGEQRQEAQQRAQDRASTSPASAGTRDSGTVGQLDRDSASRADGAQRTRDASTARSSGSSSSGSSRASSSYRPSGGGARSGGGGGGRRR